MSKAERDSCSEWVRCETWADGSWWEICRPQGWLFTRDSSVRGWPHELQSPNGSRLTIFSAFSWNSASSEDKLVPSDVPPELRQVWLTAAHGADQDTRAASSDLVVPHSRTRDVQLSFDEVRNRPRRMVEAGRRLLRRKFGVLHGFLYERESGASGGWTGYFCGEGRWLHVMFALSTAHRREIDEPIAFDVLQSFRVNLPGVGAQR